MNIIHAVTVKMDKPGYFSVRAWRTALKAAHEAEGRTWRDRFLKLHFERQGKGRYQYQPRSRRYLIEKAALARIGRCEEGGQADLVLTGLMREYILTTPQIRAYPTRVTITMAGPRYLTMNPKPPKPNMAREVCAVTDDERSELSRVLRQTLDAAMATAHAALVPTAADFQRRAQL
jgi:hypothetical protein